jgi:hypothetical protein
VPFDFETTADRLDALAQVPAGVQRGKALEDLVAQMLEELPGVSVPQRNILTAGGEAKI